MSGQELIRRHQLTVFLVGSVVLGSLVTAVLMRIPTSALVLPLIALPISYIPAVLAVLLLRAEGDAGERDAFRRRLTKWRLRPRWYLIALTVVPLAHLAGVALATFWGGLFPVHLERFALLPLFLITNLGEEIGWRGYALPRLQQRFSPLVASLILGAVWAAFHWLALAQNPSYPLLYVAVGSVSLVAMSVVMTWLFNRTGSVVLMVLLHATYDTVSIGVVPLAGTTVPLLAFALSAAALCLVAATLVLITGPELGRLNQTERMPGGSIIQEANGPINRLRGSWSVHHRQRRQLQAGRDRHDDQQDAPHHRRPRTVSPRPSPRPPGSAAGDTTEP